MRFNLNIPNKPEAMWPVLLIFYFVFGTASYLFRRTLAQKLGEHNKLINAVFFIFFLLPAAIVLSFFFPHNLHIGTLNFALLFIGGLIWPLYWIVSFKANENVDVGIFTVINNLSPLITLAIAIPFLHESLEAVQFVGVGLLIVSGVLAASTHLQNRSPVSTRGLLWCFLTAFILGAAVVYERAMLNRVDFGAYLIYGWGSQVLWGIFLAREELKKLPMLLGKGSLVRDTILAWGAVSVLRSTVFIWALKLSSASLFGAATNFLSVAVLIGAYIFLRERRHMLFKTVAVVVGVIGLFLITK